MKGDVYEFETIRAEGNDGTAAKSQLNEIAVVPNPYIATHRLEPRNQFNSGRGERVIQFIHLPPSCVIRIFTLRGQLVDTINHQSSVADGTATWDLVSRDGIDIAFGVYVFHVEAPDIGNKTGRFAIIK
jgi:hypothetical protein